MQVATEESLVGDLRQGLASLRDGATFLGLDQLMDSALPRSVGHNPPGILVDNLNLVAGNDVLHIAAIEVEGGQRMLHELLARAPNGPKSRQTGRMIGDLAFAVRGEARRLIAGVQI